jgi:endonuclease-3
MSRKEKFKKVIRYFSKEQPAAETELEYTNPYELLVAVILSAQCTDKRVNMTMPGFLQVFPNVFSLANAEPEKIFPLIRSISYPNNKAKHLSSMAKMLVEEFGGEVPGKMEDLLKLPGVGRKTANVIASVIFNQPAMPVDTHVFRVSARIGLTVGAKNPLQAEKQLVKYLPENKIAIAHHWLILHGRYICIARNPRCGICGIKSVCSYYERMRRDATIRRQDYGDL